MRQGPAAFAAMLLFASPLTAQTADKPAVQSAALSSFAVVESDGVPAIPKPLTDKPGDPKEGLKVLVGRRLGNCLACHQLSNLSNEAFHGELGPSLDGVASRWDEAKLRMIVVDPKKVFTDETVMPAFYRTEGLNRVRPEFVNKPILNPQQVEDVVAYLMTLK
jgi:sulfur-oxidizing protein SoxX